jgi:hypothetical protein
MSTATNPVQAQLIVNAPADVTVSAPDTTALVAQYTTEILPMSKYTISTPEQYVQGKLDWSKAKAFSAGIETLFKEAKSTAYKAHKAITSLEAQLKAPADQIAAHVGNEILKFEAEQSRLRRIEEARLQAEENARVEAERVRLQAIADAERMKAEEARAAALSEMGDLEPWEIDDKMEAALPVVPDRVIVATPEAAPVRLVSNLPLVMGGPRTVDKPWTCVIKFPEALLLWILEKPEERIQEYVIFNYPALNAKARELGSDLGKVVSGCVSVREQTLKRS